jgi:transposase
MKRTKLLEELRKMRFEDTYNHYQQGSLTQEEAASLLGVCARTFRRYIMRYKEEGLDGLIDRRISQLSHRMAPVDEVCRLTDLYRNEYYGWNVRHFHNWYQRQGGGRSYSWVKNKLQDANLVLKAKGKGKHRKRRERSPMAGMMIHQDGSTHQWIDGVYWDLIVTMDDATSEHYSMFFIDQEGTMSSFKGVKETIEKRGLFCSFYSDRGSHYWYTPEAGGKVSHDHLTQFGRAMQQLGINMIAAYSPEARGRSERAFRTHQERLPKELAKAGIVDMASANRYVQEVYMPAYNKEFMVKSAEDGDAFVSLQVGDINEILCEHYERVVGKDNCVHFEGLILQIPRQIYRFNFVKVKVMVHCYLDGHLALFHGPRKLAEYGCDGQLIVTKEEHKEVDQACAAH